MTDTFVTHCITFYEALEERATLKPLPSGGEALVFIGHITPVWNATGISQAYYTPVMNALERVGAVLRIQRGGRSVDTVISLEGLPDEWPDDLGWRGSKAEDPDYAIIMENLRKINEGTIGGINVITALLEMEERLTALEGKLLKTEAVNGKTAQRATDTSTTTNP